MTEPELGKGCYQETTQLQRRTYSVPSTVVTTQEAIVHPFCPSNGLGDRSRFIGAQKKVIEAQRSAEVCSRLHSRSADVGGRAEENLNPGLLTLGIHVNS